MGRGRRLIRSILVRRRLCGAGDFTEAGWARAEGKQALHSLALGQLGGLQVSLLWRCPHCLTGSLGGGFLKQQLEWSPDFLPKFTLQAQQGEGPSKQSREQDQEPGALRTAPL